jgi:predicted SAM-dependent methyltransferase
MNPKVVERVVAAGHRGVRADAFHLEVEDGSVAVVRMNHVLEHLYEPTDVLSAIRSKLAPGGVVHVAVPNGRSVWAALSRSFWFNADPRHIVQYAPRHLIALAARAGFSDVQIVHEVITRDMARTIRYLRDPHGARDGRRTTETALDDRMAGLLECPARISAAIGRGDRFHALLRR